MATTVARVDIEADLDGSRIAPQVKKEAEEAGRQGGDAFGKEFNKNVGRSMGDALKDVKSSFTKGGAWEKTFTGGGEKSGNAFTRGLRNTLTKAKGAFGNIGGQLKKLWAGIGDGDAVISRQTGLWKKLSANTRQWTLIIAAVIGAIGDLAGLGSAAGSGIFVLAGAFGALATGGILAFVAFKTFLGDLSKVPAAIRPARKAFDEFSKTVRGVMDELAVESFKGTEGAWKKFGQVVKDLVPGFKEVGKVVNRLITDLADNLDASVVEDLNSFLGMSAKTLDRVVRAVGRVGKAMLSAFASPAFQHALEGLLGWIDTLADRFAAFLTGPGFDEWLRHGEQVFGALGGLLDTTGRLLNDLVTDETIDKLVEFIGHIDGFLSGGGAQLLDFAQRLDLFGLAAQALDDFGKALEPLAGPMADFADAFNVILGTSIDQLAGILGDIARALAPFVQGIADFMGQHPDEIAGIITAMAAAFVVLKGAQGLAGVAGKLEGIVGQFKSLQTEGPKAKDAVSGAVAGILAVLLTNTDGQTSGNDYVTGLTSALTAGFVVGGPVGAALAGFSALVFLMIQDLTDNAKGPAEEGWLQIFDPNNYEGAGIGPLKDWFANTFQPAVQEGTGNAVTAWSDMLIGFRDETQTKTGEISTGWEGFLFDFRSNVQTVSSDIAMGWSRFLEGIRNNVQTVSGDISTRWLTNLNKMKADVAAFWAGVVAGWNGFWGDVRTAVATGTAEVIAGWSKLAGAAQAAWSGVESAIRTAVSVIKGIINGLKGTIDAAIGWFNSLFGAANNAKSAGQSASGGGGKAMGGVVFSGRRLLVGEDGPEAIVPLRRSLSRVDPSVRWLSAIAQNKTAPPGPSGSTGPGRSVNIQPGAIVVQGVRDPDRAAVGVVNRIAERFA